MSNKPIGNQSPGTAQADDLSTHPPTDLTHHPTSSYGKPQIIQRDPKVLSTLAWPARKVLLVVYRLGAGGTERQFAEIAKNLDRNRYVPHVAYLKDDVIETWSKQELESLGIPMIHLPLTSMVNRSFLKAASILRAYIEKHGIDVVHAFDAPSAFFGVPLARFQGVPLVLASQRGNRASLRKRHQWFLKLLSDQWAHGQVVNCEAMRQHLTEDWSIEDDQIRVCYNGLDTNTFHPRGRKTLLDATAPTIGITCVLRKQKGLFTLLDAFGKVHQKYPNARLWIVGSGPLESALWERSSELGIRDAFNIFPSTKEVAAFLRQIDIFTLPSVTEALSNSMMEAMACGCCPVASRVGGNPELVRHGINGLLFQKENAEELAQSLELLITRPEERIRLALQAQRDMEGFSIGHSVQQMESIYDTMWNRVQQ